MTQWAEASWVGLITLTDCLPTPIHPSDNFLKLLGVCHVFIFNVFAGGCHCVSCVSCVVLTRGGNGHQLQSKQCGAISSASFYRTIYSFLVLDSGEWERISRLSYRLTDFSTHVEVKEMHQEGVFVFIFTSESNCGRRLRLDVMPREIICCQGQMSQKKKICYSLQTGRMALLQRLCLSLKTEFLFIKQQLEKC